MNNRILGIIALTLCPGMHLMMTVGQSKLAWAPVGSALMGLLFLIGWACSVTGLRYGRVTGNGRGAQVLYMVQLVLLGLAATQQVFDMTVGQQEHVFYHIADAAWPASMVLMLVVGTAVLRARVWTDWRRFVPLACGFFLPGFALLAFTLSREASVVIMGWYTVLIWGLMGYAVHTTPEARPAAICVLAE